MTREKKERSLVEDQRHGTVQDITEREQTENALRRSYDTQLAISELLKFSMAERTLPDVLERALELILDINWLSLESRGCMYIMSSDGTELVMTAQKNMEPKKLASCARVSTGDCLCGRAASEREIVFASGLDERHERIHEHEAPHGHYCVPVMHRESLLAVINLYLNEGHQRSLRDEEFLSVFASALAGIIANKTSEEEKNRLNKKLQETFLIVARSQREWQETFDSITDMISIHNNEHTIVKANKAFARHFNTEPRSVVNRKCYELFHDMNAPVMNCPHARTLAENRAVSEEITDPKTGKILLVTTYPYAFPGSDEPGTIHIIRDITDERQKEMRLIMSERLASLGQMASGVAHEINNPLASIAGCAEGLLNRIRQEKFDAALFENYLNIILEEIMRCKGITTSMLSIVRKASYDYKVVDIHDVLEKTLEIIGFQGRLREAVVDKAYSASLPAIHGSEGELKQVFLAIMLNALDATEDKGSLGIRTAFVDGSVEVTISDNGPGIPFENRQKIFEPFFTTKSDRGGTGLGLSITGKIIESHHGTINVSAKDGKGTMVKVTLPATRAGQ